MKTKTIIGIALITVAILAIPLAIIEPTPIGEAIVGTMIGTGASMM